MYNLKRASVYDVLCYIILIIFIKNVVAICTVFTSFGNLFMTPK